MALTVGIVGAGGIAPSHVTGWQSLGVELINYAEEGSEQLCERFGMTATASLDELLDRCDVVDLCTPTITHHELALTAAAAGRHVVCEKPLARTSELAREMISACDAAGVQLHVTHVVRYFPAYAAAQRAVAAGEIGTVAVQRHVRMGGRPSRGWFADPVASGGIVFDLMIHDLDFSRWVAGEVTTVFSRDSNSLADPTAAVQAHVVLTHASGAVSECTAIWRPGGRFGTNFTIAGDGGVLRHDSLTDPPFQFAELATPDEQPWKPSVSFAAHPHTESLHEIHDALQGGPQPRVTARDGLVALLIAEAAAESLQTGQPVAVPTPEGVTA